MAQTGLWRKRHNRKHGLEASESVDQERLDIELIDAAQDLADVKVRADAENDKVAHMNRLLARKRELLGGIAAAQRSRTDAEKETRAAERRVEFERRRADRIGSRSNGPRNGRPIRIAIDDGAWVAAQRLVISQRGSMICWIGKLVRAEMTQLERGEVLGSPASRRRRGPGEGLPMPRVRFLRINIDDEGWTALRLAALDAGLSVGRYLGELVEAQSHENGWRAGVD